MKNRIESYVALSVTIFYWLYSNDKWQYVHDLLNNCVSSFDVFVMEQQQLLCYKSVELLTYSALMFSVIYLVISVLEQ